MPRHLNLLVIIMMYGTNEIIKANSLEQCYLQTREVSDVSLQHSRVYLISNWIICVC